MSLSFVKTGALAATLVLSLAGAASAAALHGEITYDTKVKQYHSSSSMTVDYAYEGDDVWIIAKSGSWYKVKAPGLTPGWVKKSAVDLDYYDPTPVGPSGPSACFWGPLGYVCINP